MKTTQQRLPIDQAYHVTVETETHDFVCHMATNSREATMYFLNSFCDVFPDNHWIVYGIGKADAKNAECPTYDRVYYMRGKLSEGWLI